MFTFASITYNHENFIVEHLESIKFIIRKYNTYKKNQVNLLIVDDCSTDKTKLIIKKWVMVNSFYFDNVKIIVHDENLGINKTFIDAINNLKTQHFKILAGDDLYYDYNIFKFPFSYDFVTTPMIYYNGKRHELKRLDNRTKNIEKITKSLLKNEHGIQAPGTFFSYELVSDLNYQNFLLKFVNAEGYPSWYFWFIKKKLVNKYLQFQTPIVIYRSYSGISNNKDYDIKLKNKMEKDKEKYIKMFRIPKKSNRSNIKKYLYIKNYYNKLKSLWTYRHFFHNNEFSQYHKIIMQLSNEFMLENWNKHVN